jgi:iron(III) transport system substrate-binding protein
MQKARRRLLPRAAALAAAVAWPALRAAPAGGTRRLVVWSVTDTSLARPLIDDFESSHGIAVDYRELGSVELNEAVQREARAAQPQVDVVWSSAMDLQVKLVNDGHAQRHDSPHLSALPAWAVWKREAFGTTFEPIGVAWHRSLNDLAAPPATHAALLALLREHAARLSARVCTYDIQRAGLGYLIAAQDAAATPTSWELVAALGACRPRLHTSTTAMLDSVRRGEAFIAYNVLGPYAQAYARRHPEVQLGYLKDYTLVISRVAFIARRAPWPQAARAWMDHLLSRRGQELLSLASGLHAVREDAGMAHTAQALRSELGDSARPVALAPGLIAHLDRSRRAGFTKRWLAAMAPGS